MALDNTQTIDLGDGKTVQIPEFATEKTLQQLVVALKKAGMTIDADAKASKNVNKTLEKQAKQLELQFKEEKKQRAKGDLAEKKQSEKIIEKLDKGNSIDKANQGVLKKALDNIAGSGGVLGGVMGGLSKFGRFINPLTAAFAGLIKGVQAAFKFFMRLGRLENTLFRTGLAGFNDVEGQVSGGIATFAKQALDASMSIDQFAELTQQFATTTGEFGIDTMSSAMKSTRELIREQGFLGLSVAEMAGATAEVSDVLRQLGFDGEIQQETIAQQTVQLLRTTQAFTKLTNASNELIRTLTLQASQVEAFTNAMQMLSPDRRLATTGAAQTAFAGLAAFGDAAGGDLSTALSEAIGRGGLQFTQFGQDLMRTAPALFTGLQNLAETVKADGDVAGALDEFRMAIGDVDNNSREFLRALEISGDPMAKFVIKLANLNDTIDDNSFAQMKNQEAIETAGKLGVAQAKLAEVIAQVRTAFQKVLIGFLTDDVINGFARIMEGVVGAFQSVADFVKGPFFDTLNGYVRQLGDFLRRLLDGSLFNDVLTGMSSGLATMFSGTLRRALAEVIKGGKSSEDFSRMDAAMAEYKNTGSSTALRKLAMVSAGLDDDEINKFLTTGNSSQAKNALGLDRQNLARGTRAAFTDDQLKERIMNEYGEFGYRFAGTGSTASGTDTSPIGQGQSRHSSMAGEQSSSGFSFGLDNTLNQTKKNIRIMPMFGSDTKDDKTQQEKLLEAMVKSNEYTQEEIDLFKQIKNELIQIRNNTKEGGV